MADSPPFAPSGTGGQSLHVLDRPDPQHVTKQLFKTVGDFFENFLAADEGSREFAPKDEVR
jgi:hypothetical protein